MVGIREMVKEDIAHVIRLREDFEEDQTSRGIFAANKNNKKKFKVDFRPMYERYFTDNKKSHKKKIFVAVNENNVAIGMIKVIIQEHEPSFEYGPYAHVCDLFVDKRYRNFKICLNLYEHCKEWIKLQGCRYIIMYTCGFNNLIKKCMPILKMKEYKIIYACDLNGSKDK